MYTGERIGADEAMRLGLPSPPVVAPGGPARRGPHDGRGHRRHVAVPSRRLIQAADLRRADRIRRPNTCNATRRRSPSASRATTTARAWRRSWSAARRCSPAPDRGQASHYGRRMEIDLASTSTFAHGHPWEQYRWLRENAPVFSHPEADGPGFWAITNYDDVRTVSRHPRRSSSFARGVMMSEPDDGGLMAQRQMMLSMDPPQHDRFKLLVSRGSRRATPRTSARASPSSPGRSSTTSSSAVSATWCTTSPAGCRRA